MVSDAMDKLRDWRKAQGFSIEEAGRMVGISGVQWHRYEAGTRSVAPERVPDIARVTGIPAEELRPDLAAIFSTPQPEGVAQ
jgi:transcriptional regulator with XRE-family HTH domain